jgi:hypothetical protein
MAPRKTKQQPCSCLLDRRRHNPIYRVAARTHATDGRELLPDIPPDNPWRIRYERTLARHVADLGGEQNLSAQEFAILKHACVLSIELDSLAMNFARKGKADAVLLDLYGRTANTLRRQLEALGLNRRARDVTPSLSEYLRGRARANGLIDEAEQ